MPIFPIFPAQPWRAMRTIWSNGTLAGQTVAKLISRFHYYEAFSMRQVTYPVYVLRLLGVGTLVITNACGGIDRGLAPGRADAFVGLYQYAGQQLTYGPLMTSASALASRI